MSSRPKCWPLTLPQKQVAPADKQVLRVLQDHEHFSCSSNVRALLLKPRNAILLLREAFFSRADPFLKIAQLVRVNGHGAHNQVTYAKVDS
jgi:hypothetical protein